MSLLFAFGASFQLPVLHAIVIMFAVAAVITPPDVISQVSLAVPLIILYEASIISCRLVEKARAKREAELDAELAGTGKPAAGE
jgi:sec-independent protein translocase protein TatC